MGGALFCAKTRLRVKADKVLLLKYRPQFTEHALQLTSDLWRSEAPEVLVSDWLSSTHGERRSNVRAELKENS